MYGSSESHSFLISTSPAPGLPMGTSANRKLSSVTAPFGRLASRTCLFSAAMTVSALVQESTSLGEALEVMIGVAELLRDHCQPAKRMADFQLIAHAHAAVQLNRFLSDMAAGIGHLDFRRRE